MGEPSDAAWWQHDEPDVNERRASYPHADAQPARRGPARESSSGGYGTRPSRPRKDGRRIDPAEGRNAAASLPNARRRSVSGERPGERGGYHRSGPAHRNEYGSAEYSSYGRSTIPDDRAPRPRRRPQQQRPLGWSTENVPQMHKTIASNGGWGFKSLKPRRSVGPKWGFIAAGVLAVVLLVLIVRGVSGCVAGLVKPREEPEPVAATTSVAATTEPASADPTAPATKVLDAGRRTASGEGRMSFSAVGDNLINENLLGLADSWAGSTGDGEYDFTPFYREVKPFIQDQCDVSFVNQETTLGGTDRFDYMGYPSYNTPDSMADAVADTGWRIVATNSNHTYDTWTPSIEHAQEVWNSRTGLVTIGSYASEEDRATVRVVECNGIKVAALSYSYGQNGYEQSDLPNDYSAVPYDADRLKEEVAQARKVADVVLVYMHWGAEYKNEPSDEQREMAQVCADAGVDVVIGSHVHVIQPVEWVSRSGGGKMLCAYGLGDFLAGYGNNPDCIMSGMITFDFVRTEEEGDNVGPGGIAVENVVWHPLVEHMVGDTDVVRFVKGYSDEDARANELLSTLDDPHAWLIDQTREVIGDDVTIDV